MSDCGGCSSMIYKSDGTAPCRMVGDEDFCGGGCLIVKDIRVPFPDCVIHGNPLPQPMKTFICGKDSTYLQCS